MTPVASADELVERAMRDSTGGEVASTTYDALAILVDSARDEADLNPFGVQIFESWAHERLVNRMAVEAYVASSADVADERVERPLIVLGMLRTGTTILLELLAADGTNRPLMKWEALDCLPPPTTDGFASDARVQKWVERMDVTYSLLPDLKSVHWEAGDGPTECSALLGQSFRALDWLRLFHVPGYVDWYLACDLAPAYEFHRTALRLLQSDAPGRWVLKEPAHMLGLDALVDVYPDARLVVTHRDPRFTVPSSVSLSKASLPNALTRHLDTDRYWGPLWLATLGTMVDRMMEFRARRPDIEVYDVAYDELAADPVGVVASIYDHFGDSLSREAELAMSDHLAGHPRGADGPHDYSLADTGLSAADVNARFEAYRRRFGPLL